MSEKGVITLAEFEGRGNDPWWRCLSQDVLDQIMASNAGGTVIARWLVSIGVKDATRAKVETLLILRKTQLEKS